MEEKFDLIVNVCPVCKRKIMVKCKQYNIFSSSCFYGQDAQMKNKGIVYQSMNKFNNEYICEVCEKEGKAGFICYSCNQNWPSSEVKKSFGYDPTDFLCKNCYEKTPAAEWDRMVEKLKDEHRYDFE